MIGFILADLKRLWAASLVIVTLVALASALGIGITLQERALRLGSARAADKFDLVIGAALSDGAALEGRPPSSEHEAVIGSAVGLTLGQSFEPMHGAAGNAGHVHSEFSYQVTGRLPSTGTAWDRAIIVPIEAVWDVHGLPRQEKPPGVPAILVKPRTIADAYKLRGDYRCDTTVAAALRS